jgi:hypothetical protein
VSPSPPSSSSHHHHFVLTSYPILSSLHYFSTHFFISRSYRGGCKQSPSPQCPFLLPASPSMTSSPLQPCPLSDLAPYLVPPACIPGCGSRMTTPPSTGKPHVDTSFAQQAIAHLSASTFDFFMRQRRKRRRL